MGVALNDRLFQRAASQHALFTAVQARECGVSRSALARSVARGHLAVPHPGVFAVAGAPGSWERRLMAVLLAVPSAVASHRSAARLWQLVDPDDDTVEVTVPRNHGPRPAGVAVHRSGDLTQAQVSLCRGVWVTNPLRTIVDLGAVMPSAGVEDALDRGLIRRLYSVAGVEWMLAGLSRQGRHGTGVLGRVLDRRALGSKPPDGMLEPRMARLLRSAG
ncbi:MAG: type IV toxin-antitoxin system AbiEi family antitoxin domain-containing protein, partial [Acidimicrobiia bacterium]